MTKMVVAKKPARADEEYLRKMFPDYDKLNQVVDYKTRCRVDADFAKAYPLPPTIASTRTCIYHNDSIDGVRWIGDAGDFVAVSHDKTMTFWNEGTRKPREAAASHKAGIYHCDISPDRKTVATCGGGSQQQCFLWDVEKGTVTQELPGHHSAVYMVQFSKSDPRRLVSCNRQGGVLVHTSGHVTDARDMHVGTAECAGFCWANPELVMSGGVDGMLRWFDCRQPVRYLSSMVNNVMRYFNTHQISKAHGGDTIYGLEWIDEHTVVSCGADYKIKRWDLRMYGVDVAAETICSSEFRGHTGPVRSMAVHEHYMVSGCEDGSVRLWDLSAPTTKHRGEENIGAKLMFTEHKSHVTSVALRGTPHGGLSILSGSWDQTVKIYTVKPEKL